jgi:hypothetical protein
MAWKVQAAVYEEWSVPPLNLSLKKSPEKRQIVHPLPASRISPGDLIGEYGNPCSDALPLLAP